MPRLQPKLLARAKRIDPLLPLFLPANYGSIAAARSELRWVRKELPNSKHLIAGKLRQHFVPLQYILGSQPFHCLDILCKPGVLIPRWETEEWASRLTSLISRHLKVRETDPSQSRIFLDLCTGTGCIPLLLSTVAPKNSHIIGVEISPNALSLFNQNITHNAKLGSLVSENSVSVIDANVLDTPASLETALASSLSIKTNYPSTTSTSPFLSRLQIDLITSNPPYIPQSQYRPPLHAANSQSTDRSVRLYEPKLALVGDKEFYTAIFNHAVFFNTKAVVCEVGDISQINHMIDLAMKYNQTHNDDPSMEWAWLSLNDSSNKPRVVALWRKKSEWAFIENMQQNY